jgi:hypothetical protein
LPLLRLSKFSPVYCTRFAWIGKGAPFFARQPAARPVIPDAPQKRKGAHDKSCRLTADECLCAADSIVEAQPVSGPLHNAGLSISGQLKSIKGKLFTKF